MSVASGIPVAEELLQTFFNADSNGVRWIKAVIRDNTVVVGATGDVGSGFASEFDTIADALDESSPAVVLVRLDKRSPVKYQGRPFPMWLVVQYVPDTCKVRDKMIYASSLEPLKHALGYRYCDDDWVVTSRADVSWPSYTAKRTAAAAKPFSRIELAQREADKAEERARQEQYNDSSDRFVAGPRGAAGIGGYHVVSIPLSTSARDAVRKVAEDSLNFVQLAIDQRGNTVDLVSSSTAEASEVERLVNKTEPRFYLYAHRDSGKCNIYFIYVCPPESKVTLRMPYSTSKPSVAAAIEAAGVSVERKLEITDLSDFEPAAFSKLLSRPASAAATAKCSFVNSSGVRSGGSVMQRAAQFGGSTTASSSHSSSRSYGASGNGGLITPATSKYARKSTAAPIWSAQIAGGGGGSGGRPVAGRTKKNLVLPPPGAYC